MIAERILYRLSKAWPDKNKEKKEKMGDPRTEDYHFRYALLKQYDSKVKGGTGCDIRDKAILEIGCGHGGISIFCAINGASRVVGLDIDQVRLNAADKAARFICEAQGRTRESLPVEFAMVDAYAMTFPPDSFDLVFADNVFEHFDDSFKVLQQCHKVLKKGGRIVIKGMPSYYSKYGLHLKNGLKVPWANLFFSEKTICKVMIRLAEEDPSLLGFYPGIANKPVKVRYLRASGDLNGITYGKFKKMAAKAGFRVKNFKAHPSPAYLGFLVSKIPLLRNSILMDIFSYTCSCELVKT